MGHPAQSGSVKLEGVLECVRKCAAEGVADFIEINESCPNVAHAHEDDGALERRLKAIVKARDEAARPGKGAASACPILVKLRNFGDDPAHTVKFMSRCGVAGLVGLNTQIDYASFRDSMPASDLSMLDWYTSRYKGGLSGPAILPRSMQQMQAAASACRVANIKDFVLVHVGGIMTQRDVHTSRKESGAVLRQWYTGLMHAIATRPTNDIYGVTRD
jgi:dihydroorotate dehydrogenase